MKDTAVQPRVGASYLLTADARNVIRASYGKLYEQVNGRDYIVQFGSTRRRRGRPTSTSTPDGTRTTVVTPPTRSVDPNLLFDKDLHQPYIHEYSVGYNRQLKGQISVGVACDAAPLPRQLRRSGHQRHLSRSGRVQPFGGFGRVDPNQGIITQETNATWTQVIVNAVEATFAKNMSNNFQLHRQLHAPVAAPQRHVEPDRSGALRAAGRLREQPRPVAAAVRQRRRQHAERRRPRIGRGLSAVLAAHRRPVERAVEHQRRAAATSSRRAATWARCSSSCRPTIRR